MKHTTLTLLITAAIGTSMSANAAITAYWSFDSDFTADVGGSGFNLTANGDDSNLATAGDSGGKFGNAATFDRGENQYAITAGNVLTSTADFSYSAWYNSDVGTITGSNRYFILETISGDTIITDDAAWTASAGLRNQSGDS